MTRKEAIARIKDHKIAHKMDEPRAIYISEALDMAIEALEQKPKTGHWTETGRYEEWYDEILECSECEGHMLSNSKFCPWCGTRMIKTQKGNNDSNGRYRVVN